MDAILGRAIPSYLKLRQCRDDFHVKTGTTLLLRERLCMTFPLVALPHEMFPVKNTRRLF